MTKCSTSKDCPAGKICGKDTKRCRNPKAAGGKKAPAGKKRITDAQIEQALYRENGTLTNMSLVSKGRSKKLGAGMGTLVKATRKELSKMDKKAPAKKRAPTGGRKKAPAKKRAPAGTSACGTKCTPTAKGTPRVRQTAAPCKCMVPGSQAATRAGVCMPRMGKNGKPYDTVRVIRVYETGKRRGTQYTACVKAGTKAVRDDVGGNRACPAGKVLKRYTATVPDMRNGVWTGKYKYPAASRCVKAVGDRKNCPVGQVVAIVPSTFQGKRVNGQRCVMASTAAKKRYRVVKQGTLPGRTYTQHKGLARSIGY